MHFFFPFNISRVICFCVVVSTEAGSAENQCAKLTPETQSSNTAAQGATVANMESDIR